jgi:hypothetical protein
MRINFPKYLIANESLDSPVWIVRTRNPFVMARCEPVGLVGVKLFCWPPEIRELPKVDKVIPTMAEIYAEDVEGQPGLPSEWSFVFNEAEKIPEFLVGDSYQSEFSAVIHPRAPRFIIPIGNNNELTMDLASLDGELPPGELVKKAIRFYERFKREEDTESSE